MIDISTEQVINLREAPAYCPRRRRGKKPHVSTVYRWVENGLEVIRIGGQLCTSVQALQRFFDRLTKEYQLARNPRGSRKSARTHADSKHQDSVQKELDRLGI